MGRHNIQIKLIQIIFLLTGEGQSIDKLYKFTPSGENQIVGNVAADLNLLRQPSQITFCVWTKIYRFYRPSVIMSIGSTTEISGDVSIGMHKVKLVFLY